MNLVLYRVTATFECPADHVTNCMIGTDGPVPVAQCDPGDLATGGASYRTTPSAPLQQFVAVPYPTFGDAPVTGFTPTPQGIGPGDVVYVVAICADL